MLKTKSIDIQAIDHIVIRAHDLSRMTAFYRDVLGCDVERESDKYKLVQLIPVSRSNDSSVMPVLVTGIHGSPALGVKRTRARR